MTLIWDTDWEQNRAAAKAPHGTYTIARMQTGDWVAAFTRVDTEQYRRTKHAVDPRSTVYGTPAEAMRACNRHAERYSPDSSNRFTMVTPLPQ